MSIKNNSEIKKYKIDPLLATTYKFSNSLLISYYFLMDIPNLSLTALAISLLILRLSINSISSKIIPLLAVSKSNILSSPYLTSYLSSIIERMISFNNLSSYGDSIATISYKSYSISPSSVTVKLIILI